MDDSNLPNDKIENFIKKIKRLSDDSVKKTDIHFDFEIESDILNYIIIDFFELLEKYTPIQASINAIDQFYKLHGEDILEIINTGTIPKGHSSIAEYLGSAWINMITLTAIKLEMDRCKLQQPTTETLE